MRRILSLVAVAGVAALVLFGCGGGGYETSSGFQGASVNISGLYLVQVKDPSIMPNLYSLQVTHSGKSIQAVDNLGQLWAGNVTDFGYYGVYPVGQEPGAQQDPTQQQQQQQQQLPDTYHADIHLTMQTGSGPNNLVGVVDTNVPLTLGATGQQQGTTANYTTISGTVVDSRGNSGYITFYNSVGYQDTTTTVP